MKSNKLLVRNILLIGSAVTLSMFAVSAYAWWQLPSDVQLPIHWNAVGEVDRYAGKAEGLLLLPAISIGIFALLILILKIEPRKLNLSPSTKAFTAMGACVGGILFLTQAVVVAVAFGLEVNAVAVITAATGALMIVIGNFMGKIRSNFMFGVRTPWTLSSELSWNKTNRLAGKLLMALGLFMLILAFTATTGPILIYGVGGLLVAITAFSFVYSYLVWRGDTEAQRA